MVSKKTFYLWHHYSYKINSFMKTMKWLMMCMLAISACCLSACGNDDESIRLTPTDENQQPINSDYTLQLSPFSKGESYYIYGAETPFTIENSNKEVVEVIEGNSTLTFKPPRRKYHFHTGCQVACLFPEDKSSLSFPFFPCNWPKSRSDWR